MTVKTPTQKIQEWRDTHPGQRITTEDVKAILGLRNLRSADLWGADLWGADLRSADLRSADLWGADLWGANLRGADLWGANLRGANLRGADLWGANLRGANLWGALRLDGLPSGQATMLPTPDGWTLRVGCWTGTVDELATLVAGDDWPEARGAEIERRRPGLLALIAMCEAHQAAWPDLVGELAEKWGDR